MQVLLVLLVLLLEAIIQLNANLVDNCRLTLQLAAELNQTFNCESRGITINKSNKTLLFSTQEQNEFPRITEIYVVNHEIETISPGAFAMAFLEKLHLSNNSIRNLSRETFGRIPNLQLLDLSKNNLTENDILAFDDLASLKLLNLSYNNIRYFDANTFATISILEVLDVSYNSLNAVSSRFLHEHTSLRTLYLQNNQLSTLNLKIPSVKHIDASFNIIRSLNLPDLAQLNLINNKIQNLITFGDTEINLSNNSITDFRVSSENTRYISASFNQIQTITTSFFPNSIHLEYLNLSNNIIANIEAYALSTLIRIKVIILSHNKLSDFKSRVFDNLNTLEVLDISHNQFVYLYDIPFASTFSFDNLSKLNKIVLNNNQWSCEFLTQLSKATFTVIGAYTTCKSDVNDFVIDFDRTVPVETDIPFNNADEEGIPKTSQAITNFPNITNANHCCDFNNESVVQAISKYLENEFKDTTVFEYIKNLTRFSNGYNHILQHPQEQQGNASTPTQHDFMKTNLFAYILLINTITTALLLLVIIIGLCVICKRKDYKVHNFDGY